jgi:hypothetical protein
MVCERLSKVMYVLSFSSIAVPLFFSSKTCMCTGSSLDYLDLFKLDWFRPLVESACLLAGGPRESRAYWMFSTPLPLTAHSTVQWGEKQVLWNFAQSVAPATEGKEDVCFWKALILWLNHCSACVPFSEIGVQAVLYLTELAGTLCSRNPQCNATVLRSTFLPIISALSVVVVQEGIYQVLDINFVTKLSVWRFCGNVGYPE